MTLLPCPFCGGTDLQVRTEDVMDDDCWSAYVECSTCLARGSETCELNEYWLESEEEAESEAVAAWNRRADRDTISETLSKIIHEQDKSSCGAAMLIDELRAEIKKLRSKP